MDLEKFIGMGKRRAQNEAEAMNLVFHLVSVDGERILGYPTDGPRNYRLCVEIQNDKVSKVILS